MLFMHSCHSKTSPAVLIGICEGGLSNWAAFREGEEIRITCVPVVSYPVSLMKEDKSKNVLYICYLFDTYIYILYVLRVAWGWVCAPSLREKISQPQTPKAFSAQEVQHFPDHSRNPYQSVSCYCKWSWISKLFLETWSFCHWKVIWI